MTKVSQISRLFFILFLFQSLLVLGSAQTLREFAQGQRGNTHRRVAKDLWDKLRAGNTDAQSEETERVIINASNPTAQNQLAKRIPQMGGTLRNMSRATGTLVVEMPRKQLSQLLSDNAVEYISPDRPVQATGHIENTTGATAARGLNFWLPTYDGAGVGIAIIDSGIEKTHELFNKNLVSVTPSLLGGSFSVYKLGTAPTVTAEKNFVPFELSTNDPYGHGSMIASLISGRKGFLSESFTGIAPGANLINLRVLNSYGMGRTSDVIAAIDWCIANRTTYNIRVINLSLGAMAADSYTKDPLCLAARRAFNAGIVVVAAAGNYGKDIYGRKIYGGISSPGIDPSVITVGATNTQGTDSRADDTVATFSSRGPTRGYVVDNAGNKIYDNILKPEIVAPGNRLRGALSIGSPDNRLVTQTPSLKIYSNTSGLFTPKIVGVMQLSGTSVAAPIVSGAVALMLQANPNLTPSLVKSILMYSAQPLPRFNTLEQGAGQINIHGAVSLSRLIRKDLAGLNHGNAMLTGALPSLQASIIAGQNVHWSQAVLHRYGFFHGSKLMTHWQGMYGRTALPADAISYVNGAPVLRADLVTSDVAMNSGIVFADGQALADGNIIAGGIVFADGSLDAGDSFVDGRIIFDPFTSLIRGIFPLVATGE